MNAQTACYIFAAAFFAAGILGYIPNPIVSGDDIFALNGLHNLVHILSGFIFLAGAMWLDKPKMTLQVMGVIYLVVALLGFVWPSDMLLGLVRINMADNVLHLLFAAVILAAGFGLPKAAAAA